MASGGATVQRLIKGVAAILALGVQACMGTGEALQNPNVVSAPSGRYQIVAGSQPYGPLLLDTTTGHTWIICRAFPISVDTSSVQLWAADETTGDDYAPLSKDEWCIVDGPNRSFSELVSGDEYFSKVGSKMRGKASLK
jgi:hypothetical protein